GLYLLDLVEPDDGGYGLVDDPLFGKEFVYGNVLYNPPVGASALIHFGGDTGTFEFYQKVLFFYDNTVVNRNDQLTGRWRTSIFAVDTNAQTVFAENNIFYSVPVTPGLYAGNWCLAETEGTFFLGANWINQDYLVNRDGYPFDGVMYLQDRLITGDD